MGRGKKTPRRRVWPEGSGQLLQHLSGLFRTAIMQRRSKRTSSPPVRQAKPFAYFSTLRNCAMPSLRPLRELVA